MKKRKGKERVRRIEYYDDEEDSDLIKFSTFIKIIKIIIIIFIILFLKFIINTYDVKDSFEIIQENNYDLTLLNNIKSKIQQKKYREALNIISYSYRNITDNYKLLLIRAKIYYKLSDYYKSLKDCELYLNLSLTKKTYNIDFYQLLVLNYIKMFDLDNAKEKLNICQQIDKNNLKSKELFSLIEQEEKKNEENIKKYKQYPAYINFMKSLYKMGIYLNKLEISFISESYRFCRATEDIYNDEILLRLPLESLITKEVARNGDMGKYFTDDFERKLDSPTHCLITTFLLNEIDKGNQSKWKFYTDFLPSSYNSFPTFYGEKEYELLKGTQFLELLDNKNKNIKKDYDALITEIPGYSKYEFNYFKKMRQVVGSRVFGVHINKTSNTIIAPFADLLNHKSFSHTYWNYDDNSTSFFIKGTSDIQKGNEVFDSYGPKTNRMFLLYYGFTFENNTNNRFRIDLILNNNTYPYIEEKMAFLGNNKLNKSFIIDTNLSNKIVNNFFSFLRFIVYNNTDFKIINTTNPFSIDNEKQLFNKIKEIMSVYLNKYPTTYDYDLEYLKNNKNNMEFNDYNCYVVRIGEKEILSYYLNMANDILLFLNEDKKNINDIINIKSGNKYNIKSEFGNKLFKYRSYLLLLFPLLNI